jgi:integrase
VREFKVGKLKERFVVTWWADGKRRRLRLKADALGDAQREAIDVIRALDSTPRGDTVADLWEAYRKDKEGRRVAAAMKFEWKTIGPHFGHLRPDQITDETCRSYTASRRKAGKHDGTIWTELGHLRSVMNWAKARRLIAHAPPIVRPAKPKPKDRYLTRAEAQKLIEAADGHIRLAIRLMLSTAARVGAVLDLTWDRVDFTRGQIQLSLPDASTLKGRATVPINTGLKAALVEARKAALSDYVVEWNGQQVASIKTGFNAAVKRAGLEGVTPHVLRHTAAVWMAEAGLPFEEIAQYMGHSNKDVTFRVYGRFSPSHLRRAADVLDLPGS